MDTDASLKSSFDQMQEEEEEKKEVEDHHQEEEKDEETWKYITAAALHRGALFISHAKEQIHVSILIFILNWFK